MEKRCFYKCLVLRFTLKEVDCKCQTGAAFIVIQTITFARLLVSIFFEFIFSLPSIFPNIVRKLSLIICRTIIRSINIVQL